METNKKAKEPPKHPEIGARLAQFIEESGQPNARQFALRAGLTPQLVSYLAAGNSIPSGETLMALATAYKDFDSDWLLTGRVKGRPATPKAPAPGPTTGPATVVESENVLALAVAEAKLEAQGRTIADQAKQIERLWAQLGKPSDSSDAADENPHNHPAGPTPTPMLACQSRQRRTRIGFRVGK